MQIISGRVGFLLLFLVDLSSISPSYCLHITEESAGKYIYCILPLSHIFSSDKRSENGPGGGCIRHVLYGYTYRTLYIFISFIQSLEHEHLKGQNHKKYVVVLKVGIVFCVNNGSLVKFLFFYLSSFLCKTGLMIDRILHRHACTLYINTHSARAR